MSGITQEWKCYSNDDSLNYNIRIFDFGQKMKTWRFGRPVQSLLFEIQHSKFFIEVYPNGSSKDQIRNISVFVINWNEWDVMLETRLSIGAMSFDLAAPMHSKCGGGWSQLCGHRDLWELLDNGDLEISVDIKLVWEYSPGRQTMKAEVTDLKRKIENMERTLERNLATLRNPGEKIFSSSSPCPECPICFDEMKPPTKIAQCMAGHLICLNCRERPEVSCCPICKKDFTGERAIGIENFLRGLFPQ